MTTQFIISIIASVICVGTLLWSGIANDDRPFIFGYPISFILLLFVLWYRNKSINPKTSQKGFTLIELILAIVIIIIILLVIVGLFVLIHFIRKHW